MDDKFQGDVQLPLMSLFGPEDSVTLSSRLMSRHTPAFLADLASGKGVELMDINMDVLEESEFLEGVQSILSAIQVQLHRYMVSLFL